MLDQIFNDIFIINLDERTDRWLECCNELIKIGSSDSRVTRVSAIRTNLHGAIGCSFSHATALTRFLIESDSEYCVVFEDDFLFNIDSASVLDLVCNFLKNEMDWDVLLLSGNDVKSITTKSNQYFSVLSSKTTSAYMVKRSYVPQLIKSYLTGAINLKKYMPVISPEYWGTLLDLYAADMVWQELQKKDNWFILNPSVVIQRPSYSDIMRQNVDYKV